MVIKNAGMNTSVTLAKIINITRYTKNLPTLNNYLTKHRKSGI
jgi:hypothetical protein